MFYNLFLIYLACIVCSNKGCPCVKSVLRNVLCSCDAASAVPLVQRGDGGTDNLQSGVNDLLERFLLLGERFSMWGL